MKHPPVIPGHDASADIVIAGWRYKAVLLSVLIAVIGYLGFVLWTGWEEVGHAIAKVGILGITITLCLSLFNYGLRFLRWQAYLKALGYIVPIWPSLSIYLAGFSLTTTPGKAGEVLRAVLLKRWDIPYTKSLAALFSERLSDLLAVLLLALFGLNLRPETTPLLLAGVAIILIGLFILLSPTFMDRASKHHIGSSRFARLLQHGLEMLHQARHCHSLNLFLSASLISVLAWAAEAWAFHLILLWMGIDLPISFAVFVYAVSMLAGAISFMPGGLGGAEAAMTGLLVWAEVPIPDAVASTFIIRLVTLWFAVALGWLFVSFRLSYNSNHENP